MGVLTRPTAFLDPYVSMGVQATVVSSGVIDGASSSTKVVASPTPGANCALVLFLGGMFSSGAGGGIASVTSSGGGPTWTEKIDNWPNTNFIAANSIHVAEIGGSNPGTFDITVTSGGRAFDWFYFVLYKVTNYNTLQPFVGEVASTAVADGASTLTLTQPPMAKDLTLAFNWVDTDNTIGATFGSSFGTWTEDMDAAGGPAGGGHAANAGQRTGSTSTSVEWTDVAAGSPGTAYTGAQCAIIVRNAPKALDNFNRADGALGANWTTATFQALNNAIIASNAASTAAAPQDSVSIYTGAGAFAADQFCEVDATLGSSTSAVGVDVRAKVATASGYEGVWSDANGGQYTIWDYVSNAEVGTPVTGVGITGTRRLRIEAIGSTINFYVNGVLQVTATDTSTTGTGNDTYPGLFLAVTSGSVPVADNWAGGDM